MRFTFQNFSQTGLDLVRQGFQQIYQWIDRQLISCLTTRWVALVGVIGCCVLMTGCVDYQLGVHFDSPNQGQFTQRIRLDNYTNPTAQAFLQQVRQQTRSVQGSFQAISQQESLITVPFGNAKDLEHKFNQFFQNSANPASDLPAIVSNLNIAQSNWLLFEHDRLTFDVDLKSLGLQGTEEFADPGKLFHLKMAVNDRTWDLNPGKLNHIETDFWMPLPLGWGTVAILTLVVVGSQLRKRTAIQRASTTI
jgi:Protein of unknown function (DUF3153)